MCSPYFTIRGLTAARPRNGFTAAMPRNVLVLPLPCTLI